jgi:hypothetical protein
MIKIKLEREFGDQLGILDETNPEAKKTQGSVTLGH